VAREGGGGAEEHGVLPFLESAKEPLSLGGDGCGIPGRAPFVLKQREAAVHQRCKGISKGTAQLDRREGQASDVFP
jgi:hypothetical protein